MAHFPPLLRLLFSGCRKKGQNGEKKKKKKPPFVQQHFVTAILFRYPPLLRKSLLFLQNKNFLSISWIGKIRSHIKMRGKKDSAPLSLNTTSLRLCKRITYKRESMRTLIWKIYTARKKEKKKRLKKCGEFVILKIGPHEEQTAEGRVKLICVRALEGPRNPAVEPRNVSLSEIA